MKQFILAWLVSLLLFVTVPIKRINTSIQPYYNEFVELVKNECPNLETPRQLIIDFGTLKDEEIGLCYYFTFKREIKIDSFFWETASEFSRRQLVFHELTHCLLNVDHVESEDNYMNPYLIYISEEKLLEQIKLNAKEHCNG